MTAANCCPDHARKTRQHGPLPHIWCSAGPGFTTYEGQRSALIASGLAQAFMLEYVPGQRNTSERCTHPLAGRFGKWKARLTRRNRADEVWMVRYEHDEMDPSPYPEIGPDDAPAPGMPADNINIEAAVHSLSVPFSVRKVAALYHTVAVLAGRPGPRRPDDLRMAVSILAPQYGEELATTLATECTLRRFCDMIHIECANVWILIKDRVAPMFNKDKGWTGKLSDAVMSACLPEYGIRQLMDAVAKHGEDSEEVEEIIEDMQERLGIPEVDTPLQAYRRAAMVGIDRMVIVEKENAALKEKFNRIKATAERMTSRDPRGRKQGGQSA